MAIYVGTSGWTYPHWEKTFFPEHLSPPERLHYYAQHFSTIEINTTFYGTPRRSTLPSRAAATSPTTKSCSPREKAP
jgi:uncharacterized protein YecE (DUF72 family)